MSSSSISSSLRLFTTKIPKPLLCPKALIPSKPHNLSFFKPISFQRLPTTPSSVSVSVSASASSSVPLQPMEQFPPKLQEIIKLFQSVQEPKAKYEQLLFYASTLRCPSSISTCQDLPELFNKSLTPSRNNGFLNMLRLMQKKALQLAVEVEKGENSGLKMDGSVENVNFGLDSDLGVEENLVGVSNLGSKMDGSVENVNFGLNSDLGVGENPVGVSNSGGLGSRGKRIKEKLERELSPVAIEVEDISYQHAGHAGVRGSDGETHFNVKVVSEEFEGKSLVKRHRLVYGLLQEELQSGLHALSIVAKTPSEVNGS
uniref:BolA protein n=1 Tax=Fagus sylvatica TaxID=28930 RepID=A0A2N9GJ38_FAGSY